MNEEQSQQLRSIAKRLPYAAGMMAIGGGCTLIASSYDDSNSGLQLAGVGMLGLAVLVLVLMASLLIASRR